MKIKWLGHACFEITSEKGIKIVTDPFDNTVGYKVPDVNAHIVTTSHGHFDHNYTKSIHGDFEVISKTGNFYVKDICIKGILSHHDNVEGKKRGDNVIYVFDIDGIKVCHLGDLGHVLNDTQVSDIGKVDVLLIPVGGYFTIDSHEACKVVKQLRPEFVIPMHYKTPVIDFPIETVEPFIEKIGGGTKVNSQSIEINVGDLNLSNDTKVYILDYEQ